MAIIPRKLENILRKRILHSGKIVVLYGARQVGKTTLVKNLLNKLKIKTLEVNADEQRYLDVLSSRDSRKLQEFTEGYSLLFLDEAQRIPEIGINLKILADTCKGLKIIATGSSSLELAGRISEPLTGRKWTFNLFPIAQTELRSMRNRYELKQELEDRLVWGSYPEIFRLKSSMLKEAYLREISSDYLYRDLLMLSEIRNSDKLRRLLKLLAFQIGSEVSLHEVGQQLEMTKETVHRYIDLLEKTFVLFSLGGFNRNLRKEITKMKKYYFYDLGIRNVLIDNFKSPSERNDFGQLWENFLIVERLKRNAYRERPCSQYFWRTYTGAEIDYVEEGADGLNGFEIKSGKKKTRPPETWLKEYPQATWQEVGTHNWLNFVL